MLAAIAVTPSAPVLVPELAGAAAAEVAGYREAALEAASALPRTWIAIGTGPADVVYSTVRGSFAGFGADVRVALDPAAPAAVVEMPLSALMAGWLRGLANPEGSVVVRVYDAALDADSAVVCGRTLRAVIDDDDEPIGVLVVADGATTLTPSAPGGHRPEDVPIQDALDDALASGDADALTRLPDAVTGRVAYQVLAGLAGPGPWAARELIRGAPYGVGYFAGLWLPPGGSRASHR